MTLTDWNEVALPASIEAEKTILGAILLDNIAYYESIDRGIECDDYYLDSHQRIFFRMSTLMAAGRAVDIVTLTNELAAFKEVEAIGGVAYLASLTEGLPRRPAISDYLRIVKDKAMARRLMVVSSQAMARAADQSDPSATVISDAIEAMEDTLARGGNRGGRPIEAILEEDAPKFEAEADAKMGETLGADLFTEDLSKTTCGIQQGELCLLCARPMQGKTEGAIQVIVKNARRGKRIHFHSLEMRAHQITRRMMRYIAQVPVAAMRDPRCLNLTQRQRLRDARRELAKLPIVIDDTHELTISEYRSRCVLAAKRWKADLIVVDYAQLLLVPRAKNALEEAKKQAETLRHIARDYCPTLALAQLRRAPPNDMNKYPDIEDILGSSSFEQAAQIVLLLHRSRDTQMKTYTGEDFCFIGKIRELQSITPLGIRAKPWGGFEDRYPNQKTTETKADEPEAKAAAPKKADKAKVKEMPKPDGKLF